MGASNREITAADDCRISQFVASAFNFLRVARVKLKGTFFSIGLDEFNGDDAAASIADEAFDESGFVHGDEESGLSPCGLIIAHGGQKSNGLND